MIFFTSDTHFGNDANTILDRELRPFDSPSDYMKKQVEIWNSQATKDDTIYHLGDFCNYLPTKGKVFGSGPEINWLSGLEVVEKINAKVILIIGNNEERVIDKLFDGQFKKFREYCLSLGFEDVRYDTYLQLHGIDIYLNHYPSKHKNNFLNLFGHVHRSTGIYKPYGFNVGVDLYNFRLVDSVVLFNMLKTKELYWSKDVDVNS